MILQTALKFLNLGYPVTEMNWGKYCFVAKYMDLTLPSCDDAYKSLMVSTKVLEEVDKLSKHKSSELLIKGGFVRFEGPSIVTRVDYLDPNGDYAIYENGTKDPLNWVEGTRLKLVDKNGKSYGLSNGMVMTDILGTPGPVWVDLADLYLRGVRSYIPSTKIS